MSIARTVSDLDAALARNVALEVEAAEWRIKYLSAVEEITDLKAQRKFADDTASELMRIIDALRAERDTWRARSGR